MANPPPMPIEFLLDARRCAFLQSYKNAFDMYLTAVRDFPHVKKTIEFEFRIVMMRLNEQLAAKNNFAQMFENFQAAMKAFPGNVNLLTDIGKYLLRHECPAEALCHFEKALEIDRSLVTVQKYMDCAKKMLFARKNYRLLNDDIRHRAYVQALCEIMSLKKNHNIEGGVYEQPKNSCVTVSALEPNFTSTWASVASKIVRKCEAQDILVANKETGALHIANIYKDRTLLITNQIDSGLLGENLLLNLRTAWEKKLAEYGLVVPGRADFYVAGANCDQIQRKYQVSTNAKTFLKVEDLFLHKEVTCSGESYQGEDISSYRNFKFLTRETLVFQIDFNSYNDIVQKIAAVVPDNAYLTVAKSGEVNVLVGWFTLHLTDNVTITTDPRSKERSEAWLPAVFFDFIPTWYRRGETFCAQFSTFGGILKFLPDCRKLITRISVQLISFLNDDRYLNEIMRCVAAATIQVTQMKSIDKIDIVDLSPFPLFGMKMLERGVRSLVCTARNRFDRNFIEEVFTRHNICLSRVKILLHRNLTLNAFEGRSFHAIFCNSLDLSGDIDVVFSRLARQLKHAYLVKGGIFMPASIVLIGQLISCKKLDRDNRIAGKDEAMLPLAKQANFLTLSQAYYIDPTQLEYEALSTPVYLARCCRELKSGEVTLPVMRDGLCNAILYWYEVEMMENTVRISTGRNDSFVDSSVFIVKSPVNVHRGDNVTVICCVDQDGSFKLDLDLELL